MYKYKRVTAADEDVQDTRFDDGMSSIKDDFDYLVNTFDKMNRDGATDQALELMEQIHTTINDIIESAVSEV